VVRRIHVTAGATVAAGDVLLEIEPSPDAQLAADSARSLSALATKALAATQERYDLKLATTQDLQAAEQAAEDAKLKADSFARRGLAGTARSPPPSGVVSKLEVTVGALVPAGAPLVAIATTGQLKCASGSRPTTWRTWPPARP